jgi:serine acetyltransferase
VNNCQGVVVNLLASAFANATLGAFTKRLGNAVVGQDAVLGDSATLCGNAELVGFVTVSVGSLIVSGARILPRVRIGAGSTVGAGSIVARPVPDDSTHHESVLRLRRCFHP